MARGGATVTLGAALALAVVVVSCASDGELSKDDLPAWLRFEPPPDCTSALFDRAWAACPSVEASFPNIWKALEAPLTPELARAFVDERKGAIAACCGSEAAARDVELDLVVGCDGRVVDVHARAPLFSSGCIEDLARTWTLPRPQEHERGVHVLVACGAAP